MIIKFWTIMVSKDFFDLVAKMRQAQKDYFNTHNHTILRRCKALERDVDKELERIRLMIIDSQL